MITASGYTKEPGIQPEGVAVTFSKKMIEEQGGLKNFIQFFEEYMNGDPEWYWMHKCKNKPQHDVAYVYIIVAGRIYWRCQFGGYDTEHKYGGTADGRDILITWPRIILAQPLIKAPVKLKFPGFQGFRYTTKLF